MARKPKTSSTVFSGDLVITSENAHLFGHLTEVTGSLYIRSNVELAALTSVGGYALPSQEVANQRVKDVAAAALLTPQALDMKKWHHSCKTTHCIAGWGIHQAGADGYKLEGEVDPATAGAILLGIEAASKFHTDDATARAWLKSKLEA
jgi:hypothetical protein